MPEVSRRAVMAAALGGLGVAAAATVPAAPALARAVAAAAAPADLTRSLFQPAIGETFRAVDGARSIPLVLTAVGDLPGTAPGDEKSFSLLFATSGYTAVDGIYTLQRGGEPDVTLFLNPIGPRAATRTMQAVIARTA